MPVMLKETSLSTQIEALAGDYVQRARAADFAGTEHWLKMLEQALKCALLYQQLRKGEA